MILNKKHIVITGGTSGIGYELVKQLHSDNHVIVIARDQKKLDDISQQFEGITIYNADLSLMADVKWVAAHIIDCFSSVDVLINNSAVQYTPKLTDADFLCENIYREIAINFSAVCALTHQLLPTLLHDRDAVIVNINSGLALAPKTTSAIYSATKGALNNFSTALRYQLEATNICVQQTFLPMVNTPMTKDRGINKISAQSAASEIIRGIENNIEEHDIGKVKLLRILLRLSPSIAHRIMKKY